MKLKFISILLVSSILAFTLNASSFANSWSEDGRYETFEGSNLTIPNILEEDTIDIEVYGNTMVNLVNLDKYMKNGDSNSVDITSNQVTFNSPSSWSKAYYYFNLKPNTAYTIKVNAINSTDISIASYIRFTHDINTLEGITGTHFSVGESGMKSKTFTTGDTGQVCFSLECGAATGTAVYKDIMLIEGNYEKEEIDYFEGIKSVSELEDNKINIEVLGENLFNVDYFTDMVETHYDEGNYGYEVKDGRNTVWTVTNHARLHEKNMLNNYYKFKDNTQYILKSSVFLEESSQIQYDSLVGLIKYTDGSYDIFLDANRTPNEWIDKTFITDTNKTIEGIYFTYGGYYCKGWIDLDSLYIGEYNPNKTEFNYDYNTENIEIDLKEPLRGLPSGVKDRVIKKNGQWVVERNTKQVVLSEDIFVDELIPDTFQNENTIAFRIMPLDRKPSITVESNNAMISDKIFVKDYWNLIYSSEEEGVFTDDTYKAIYIRIFKSRLNGDNSINGINNYFKNNPVKIVYELINPIYEPLNVSSTISLYEGVTYVSNSSNIPANMEIVVDRVANRAQEAIELAKSNPTTENISQARYWSNLMKDSTLKDEFQDEINTNTDIVDLTVDKKTTSANIDMYVKMKNSLSLSLDTNSITFNDFNASEDLEMADAVNLTVSSSLPYKVNAYLEDEIYNEDKTATIGRSVLNIKVNNENEYKAFEGIDTALLLLDNQVEGNNIVHGLDFILRGGSTHQADVYKATIKFEVEQK